MIRDDGGEESLAPVIPLFGGGASTGDRMSARDGGAARRPDDDASAWNNTWAERAAGASGSGLRAGACGARACAPGWAAAARRIRSSTSAGGVPRGAAPRGATKFSALSPSGSAGACARGASFG